MVEVLYAKYSIHYREDRSKIREDLPYYFIRLQLEGSCRTVVDGRSVRLLSGDLLLCRPGMSCETFVEPAGSEPAVDCISADYYLFCRGAWLDEWWNKRQRDVVSPIALDQGMLTLWKLLISEKTANLETSDDTTPYLLQALCLYLDRIMDQGVTPTRSSNNFDASYRIKHFIDKNVTSDFNLQAIADDVGLSITRIVHLFKKTYGQTITEYTNQTRLTYACKQIEFSNLSLESIAESVGFRNYSYFYRLFRARYGMSPKQYRSR